MHKLGCNETRFEEKIFSLIFILNRNLSAFKRTGNNDGSASRYLGKRIIRKGVRDGTSRVYCEIRVALNLHELSFKEWFDRKRIAGTFICTINRTIRVVPCRFMQSDFRSRLAGTGPIRSQTGIKRVQLSQHLFINVNLFIYALTTSQILITD